MPEVTYGHALIRTRILRSLFRYREGKLAGEVLGASQFAMSRASVRQPDAFYVLQEALTGADPHRILRVVPELVVEVVSANQNATELQRKVLEYLSIGVKVVWVFYQQLQLVTVYDRSGIHERGDQCWKRRTDCPASANL